MGARASTPLCGPTRSVGTVASVALPDCRHRAEDFYLTADEKKALVLAIAKDGVGAIDAFVKEREAKDPRIRDKIKALKDELLRRADALRERLTGEFDEKRELAVKDWQQAYDALEAARRDNENRLQLAKGMTEKLVGQAALDAPLVHIALEAEGKGKRSFWQRLVRVLRRIWYVLLTILLFPIRLIARLLGAKPTPKMADRKGHRIAIAGPGGVEVAIPAGAFDDPGVRRAVRNRMRTLSSKERARDLWNRMIGREDYETMVARLMEEQVREAAEAKRRERALDERKIEDELSRITSEEDSRKEALDAALKRLEAEQEAELERIRRMTSDAGAARDAFADEVTSQLEDAGLLERDGGGWRASSRLVDRFAEMVFAEESRTVPALHGRAAGTYAEGEGHYSREPMRTIYDVSHMDLIGTVLRARSRAAKHGPQERTRIYDDDVLVFREEREALHHVVIIMDRSGSMEENDRMTAAKRAVLALHQAVKRENPANPVDLFTMDTSVAHADLAGIWASEPRGFTNTAAALKAAGDVLLRSRAERGTIYLITDGLPEAYTKPDGTDAASAPEKCLAAAVKEARRLRNRPNLSTTILLLEEHDDLFVDAADAIAKEVKGRVVKTDPGKIAHEMLSDFGAQKAVPVMRAA